MQIDPISKCLGVKTKLPADKVLDILKKIVYFGLGS